MHWPHATTKYIGWSTLGRLKAARASPPRQSASPTLDVCVCRVSDSKPWIREFTKCLGLRVGWRITVGHAGKRIASDERAIAPLPQNKRLGHLSTTTGRRWARPLEGCSPADSRGMRPGLGCCGATFIAVAFVVLKEMHLRACGWVYGASSLMSHSERVLICLCSEMLARSGSTWISVHRYPCAYVCGSGIPREVAAQPVVVDDCFRRCCGIFSTFSLLSQQHILSSSDEGSEWTASCDCGYLCFLAAQASDAGGTANIV